MARTTSSGSSNNPEERYDALRRGTSSSTSGSTPDRSGTSGTTDRPSPAPDAENPSSTDPQAKPASSSAGTMDGSGRRTGSSPLSPSDSSADSAPQKEATPDQVLEADIDAPNPEPAAEPYAGLSGQEAIALAQEEYQNGNFDEAERLVAVAENRGEDSSIVARARGYIARARSRAGAAPPSDPGAATGGFGEEDPTAGGTLVP